MILTGDVKMHPKARRSEGMSLRFKATARIDDIFASILSSMSENQKRVGSSEHSQYYRHALPFHVPCLEGRGLEHRT